MSWLAPPALARLVCFNILLFPGVWPKAKNALTAREKPNRREYLRPVIPTRKFDGHQKLSASHSNSVCNLVTLSMHELKEGI